ncbi:MAG TPA: hypothetical protein VND19_02505 [Acetobacteraceae bacterium]|nr:hypothetical protein [Acetobacteraceae bacterium]
MWQLGLLLAAGIATGAAALPPGQVSQPPAPGSADQGGPKPAGRADDQKPATHDQRGTEVPTLVVGMPNAPDRKEETESVRHTGFEKPLPNWWGPEWAIVWATLILAAVALFQLGMFLVQLRYMRAGMNDAMTAAHAAKASADILAAGQRARIQVIPTWETDVPPGQYGYGFVPPAPQFKFGSRMDNYGQMPAANLKNRIGYYLSASDMPDNFAFDDDVPPMSEAGVLGTKQFLLGPHAPPDRYITAAEMEQMRKEELRLYLFGWVRYFDRFPGTLERVTKFCYRVRVTGNPDIPVVFIPHRQHNYAD